MSKTQDSNEGKKKSSNKGCMITATIIAVVVGVIIFSPQCFRVRGVQVPVGVTIRGSMIGINNVVQVRNTSVNTLTGVVIVVKNSAAAQTARYNMGSISSGETKEVGCLEWNWKVEPGETITIWADGRLPIVFTSEELGVR